MALTQISTDGIKNGTITGSDLATNVDLVDNQKLRLGTGNDLQIWHSSSSHASIIRHFANDSGSFNDLFLDSGRHIKFRSHSSGSSYENMAIFNKDGAVELYHNNSKKFETRSGGVAALGDCHVDSDTGKFLAGLSSDLEMYHNGTHSFIKNNTGTTYLQGPSNLSFIANNKDVIMGVVDAEVRLYHNNSKKFETTSGGAAISNIQNNEGLNLNGVGNNTCIKFLSTGSSPAHGYRIAYHSTTNYVFNSPALTFDKIATNGNFSNHIAAVSDDGFHLLDNKKLHIGGVANSSSATGDLQIYHNGSNSYIDNGTGNLYFRGSNGQMLFRPNNSEDALVLKPNGAVELYYDNSKVLQTHDASGYSGIDVLGDEGGHAVINLKADEGDDGADCWQWTAQTNGASYIKNLSNGSTYEYNVKMIGGGAVELYYDAVKKFETTSSGIQISGHINLPDQASGTGKIKLGDSNDLQIYHDGSESVIGNSTGTFQFLSPNEIRYRATTHHFLSYGNDETMAKFNDDGAVELYHDNSKKFETTSTGVTVTNGIQASGFQAISTTPYTYKYGRGSQGGGLSIYAAESAIEVVSTEDGTHGGSLLLRTVNDGVGFVYNPTDNALELKSFTPSADSFSIHGSGTNLSSLDTQLRSVKDGAVELYHNGTKKFETASTGVLFPNNGTLSQNAMYFERGQNSGDYSTMFGVTNYPDASGYGDQNDGYWAKIKSKGGCVIVINSDGGRNDGRNNYDHFSIYHREGESTNGKRAFSVDHTGGVQFGQAGINIDREWENQPSFSMTRDCNDGTNNTDNSAYFRFHGTSRTHASWTGGSTGADFSANMLLDGGNYNASDRRAKTDIVDCPYGLDVVNKLKPRKYQLVNSQLEPQGDDNINLGFIAQEIMEHIPECVNYLGDKANTPNEKGFARAYALDTNEIVAVLTKAIQELAAKVAVLESKT